MADLTSNAVLCITAGQLDGSTTFEDISESAHSVYSDGATHSDDIYFVPPTGIKIEESGIISVYETSTFFIPTIGTGNFSFEFRNLGLNEGSVIFMSTTDLGGGEYKQFSVVIDVNATRYDATVLLFDSSVPSWTYANFYTSGVTPDEGDHVYFARVSGQLRLYINGTSRGTKACTWNIPSADSQYFSIACYGTGGSYVDQVVLWNNAHWTSAFTPPTGSYDGRLFGAAELDLPLATLESTGTFPIFGYVECNTPAPWVGGIGNNPILGYGEYNTPVVVLTAAEMSLGYCEIDIQPIVIDSTGLVQIFGWSEFNTKKVLLTTTGNSQIFSYGHFNTPKVSINSLGGGSTELVLPMIAIESYGMFTSPISAEIYTPRISINSLGYQTVGALVNYTPLKHKITSRSQLVNDFEPVQFRG